MKSSLKDFQDEVGKWGDETFNSQRNYDAESCVTGMLNHLLKEYYELCDKQNGDGVADCFILLLHFAHLKGFDLLEEARKKMEINRKRKWGKPDVWGVIEHI
jgi:hypothetical protein